MDTDTILDTVYEHLHTRTVIALSHLANVSAAVVALSLDGVGGITVKTVTERAEVVPEMSVDACLVRLQALGFLTPTSRTATGATVYAVAPALGLLAAADLEDDLNDLTDLGLGDNYA